MRAIRLPRLRSQPIDQAEDVLVRDEDHQAEHEEQAEVGPGDHGRIGQRPAAHFLGDQEDHLPAVQRRDRQEVEHGQVDAQDAQEEDQLAEARAGRGVSHLRRS